MAQSRLHSQSAHMITARQHMEKLRQSKTVSSFCYVLLIAVSLLALFKFDRVEEIASFVQFGAALCLIPLAVFFHPATDRYSHTNTLFYLCFCIIFLLTVILTPSSTFFVVENNDAYVHMMSFLAYSSAIATMCFVAMIDKFTKRYAYALLLIVALYPLFLFYASVAPNIAQDLTGNNFSFSLTQAALEHDLISLLLNPWSLFPGDVSELPNIYRSKLPGYAISAKLLSFVVKSPETYLLFLGLLNVLTAWMIVAVLAPKLNGLRQIIAVAALTANYPYLIQPHGIEQISNFYFAVGLLLLKRACDQPRFFYALLSMAAFALMGMTAHSTLMVVPFIFVFGLYRLSLVQRRNAILSASRIMASAITIFLLVIFYFDFSPFANAPNSVFEWYFRNISVIANSDHDLTPMRKVIQALYLTLLGCGPVLFLLIAKMIYRANLWNILFLGTLLLPYVYYNAMTGNSEAYRQLYTLAMLVTALMVTCLIKEEKHGIKSTLLVVFMSLICANLIHKIYKIPEIKLVPLQGDVHPLGGAWVGLMENQLLSIDGLLGFDLLVFICLPFLARFWCLLFEKVSNGKFT